MGISGKVFKSTPKQRLVSLDALRGFDMFWIIGGKQLILSLLVLLGVSNATFEVFQNQFEHEGWIGFSMWDLIFPLFLFMSGVSMPYSIISRKNKGVSKKSLHIKALKRLFWLVAIGLSFTVFKFQPENIKLYTVLYLIGMANYIGSLIIIYKDTTISQIAWGVGILLGYYFATYMIAYPGRIPGSLLPANHLAGFLDQNLIPSALYMGVFDPEGSIRVIPAGVMCILGAIVGGRIKSYSVATLKCAMEIFVFGLFCIALGWLWGLHFPLIKSIWSSSFILYTAGISMLFLSIFYLIIDVWKQVSIGFIFVPIGMNSIAIYAGVRYINFGFTSEYFFKGFGGFLGELWKPFIVVLGMLLIEWFLLYFMYKMKIFIKV